MDTVSDLIARKPLLTRPSSPKTVIERKEVAAAAPGGGAHIGSRDASFELKIADTQEILFDAFRLVYDVYLRCRLTRPNHYRMRVTPYHLSSATDVFVAFEGERVVCTMSLVRDGELGLPMESAYGAEVERRRAQGISLAEVSCLAGDLDMINGVRQPAIRLMGFMAQYAWRCGVDELLIAVHPDQAGFYQRLIAFEPIGGKRRYTPVCNNPAVAMALNLTRAAADYPRLYRRFFKKLYPEAMFRHCPLSEETLEKLHDIAEVTSLMESASDVSVAGVPA